MRKKGMKYGASPHTQRGACAAGIRHMSRYAFNLPPRGRQKETLDSAQSESQYTVAIAFPPYDTAKCLLNFNRPSDRRGPDK